MRLEPFDGICFPFLSPAGTRGEGGPCSTDQAVGSHQTSDLLLPWSWDHSASRTVINKRLIFKPLSSRYSFLLPQLELMRQLPWSLPPHAGKGLWKWSWDKVVMWAHLEEARGRACEHGGNAAPRAPGARPLALINAALQSPGLPVIKAPTSPDAAQGSRGTGNHLSCNLLNWLLFPEQGAHRCSLGSLV